jgi:hypoxanthine-DNA glycosylase
VLNALPPLVGSDTRLLILGSFPGVASLRAQQYYGHPQNHFWRILQAIWPSTAANTGATSYQIRSEWLLSKKLGLWDVYASCEREGSLDSNIRCAVLNDFSTLKLLCPDLQAIAHNGGESFKHSKHTALLGVPVYKLPSTSPANASWSFERKLAAWREVFEKCELQV